MSKDFLTNLKEKTNLTTTENNDTTYKSSLNYNLDLFAFSKIRAKYDDFKNLIYNAYYEDKIVFYQNLLHLMDIRNGKGLRTLTKYIFQYLEEKKCNKELINMKNIIIDLGRFDYLFFIFELALKSNNQVIIDDYSNFFKILFNSLINNDKELLQTISSLNINLMQLFWKWLPSLRTHGKNNLVAKYLKNLFFSHLKYNEREKQYRKLLNQKRQELDIVEIPLSRKERINFENKATKSIFSRRDYFLEKELYSQDFVNAIINKKIKNFKNLFISEIIADVLFSKKEIQTNSPKAYLLEMAWKALPEIDNLPKNIISIIDVSGSMFTTNNYHAPIASSIGLGMFLAEKTEGAFHNKFITFSKNPNLVEIKGENIVEKIKFITREGVGLNTNIDKVFKLILDSTLSSNSTAPEYLAIFSDMQFDQITNEEINSTFIERWKNEYSKNNLNLPKIIFWNLNSPANQSPVLMDEINTILMGGFNANALKDLFNFEKEIKEQKLELTPLEIMKKALLKYKNKADEILQ